MKITKRTALATALALMLTLASCGGGGGGDARRFAFFLDMTGFPDSDTVRGHYEGFVLVDGKAFSTGKFVIVGTGPGAQVLNIQRTRTYGSVLNAEFGPSTTLLGEAFPFVTLATHFFITLEPEGDFNRDPSCQILVAGAINNGQALCGPMGVAVPAGFDCAVDDGMGGSVLALTDFGQVSGTFQLRSPTDDVTNATPNDCAGVWFVDDDGAGGLMAGLDLPVLPGGFRYEGWAEVDGVLRSTGKFTRPDGRDADALIAPQRGDDDPGPPFPGQDFVLPFMPTTASNPPRLELNTDFVFATGDFRTFVTVEPEPDNATTPFQYGLLQKIISPTLVNDFGVAVAEATFDPLVGVLPQPSVLISAGRFEVTALALANLGAGTSDRRGHYEFWAVVGGVPRSVDRFLVSGSNVFSLGSMSTIGNTTSVVFDAASTGNPMFPDPTMATECFVTLEAQNDADGIPSANVLVQGFVVGAGAVMTVRGDVGNGGRGLENFAGASGFFQLSTRSNNGGGNPPDDQFGILMRRLFVTSNEAAIGIRLPDLPEAWRYEGWVQEIATGRVFSTGRFRIPGAPDEDDMTSLSRGNSLKPGFPGKDFLFAVPTASIAAAAPGSITRVMVSIEPFPDNSLDPYLVILDAAVPPGAVAGGVGGVSVPMTTTPPSFSVLFAVDE